MTSLAQTDLMHILPNLKITVVVAWLTLVVYHMLFCFFNYTFYL